MEEIVESTVFLCNEGKPRSEAEWHHVPGVKQLLNLLYMK